MSFLGDTGKLEKFGKSRNPSYTSPSDNIFGWEGVGGGTVASVDNAAAASHAHQLPPLGIIHAPLQPIFYTYYTPLMIVLPPDTCRYMP